MRILENILRSSWYVVHLPDWTWGHRQDHILRSSWSAASWTPVNRTSILSYLAASEDFTRSNSYLKIILTNSEQSFL